MLTKQIKPRYMQVFQWISHYH